MSTPRPCPKVVKPGCRRPGGSFFLPRRCEKPATSRIVALGPNGERVEHFTYCEAHARAEISLYAKKPGWAMTIEEA